MKLKPLGIGSAFNSQEYGNNSWYFLKNNKIFIIDCGSTVFNTFKEKGLDKYESVNVIITHLHTDHIGSLGTLIEYLFYVKGFKPDIITDIHLRKDLRTLLSISGIEESMYNLITNTYEDKEVYHSDLGITFLETGHVPQLQSYSLLIDFWDTKKRIFYSGDTNDLPDPLKIFNESELVVDHVYIDYSINNSPVHLSTEHALTKLAEQFSDSTIHLMHLDNYIEIYKDDLKDILDKYPYINIGC
ncbi:metal-dependent hydrolase [Staphylococcus phage Alsa_3]|nr:metal-dependent hydrolase [Staphylococcus phage Alsa_3]WNM51253.1 metal-dependent hydrolase [Staphylococcus phage Alsa_4]